MKSTKSNLNFLSMPYYGMSVTMRKKREYADKEEERICEELETKLYNAQEQDLLRSFSNMGGLN